MFCSCYALWWYDFIYIFVFFFFSQSTIIVEGTGVAAEELPEATAAMGVLPLVPPLLHRLGIRPSNTVAILLHLLKGIRRVALRTVPLLLMVPLLPSKVSMLQMFI